jgi:hypothetical protein
MASVDVKSAVDQAADATAHRIENYLEQNSVEIAAPNRMIIHDEQFEKMSDAEQEYAAGDAVAEFRDSFES